MNNNFIACNFRKSKQQQQSFHIAILHDWFWIVEFLKSRIRQILFNRNNSTKCSSLHWIRNRAKVEVSIFFLIRKFAEIIRICGINQLSSYSSSEQHLVDASCFLFNWAAKMFYIEYTTGTYMEEMSLWSYNWLRLKSNKSQKSIDYSSNKCHIIISMRYML